jgi:hypothetical protein
MPQSNTNQAEHALTMFKNGQKESLKMNPVLKFSDQNWGETSARYARLVKRFSRAKLQEIVHAARTLYCATGKGQAATQGDIKGKSVMEDVTDIRGQILPSSDIKLSVSDDDEGDEE